MTSNESLSKLALITKKTVPFEDTANVKDRAGKSINFTLFKGKIVAPFGEESQNIKNAKMRPDDLLVCGYVKTGCHWVWELLTMILKGKAEYSPTIKLTAFLELASPEVYGAIPSPRVLNTHHEYDFLPDQVKTLKTKILLTVRNPKDTAVSLYNHHINIREVYCYDGEFNDWFELYRDGKVDNGSFFDYYLSWEKAINENPDHPILVLKYEDMKRDLASTVRTMAEFINVSLTNDQVEAIATAGGFSAMKKSFKEKVTDVLLRKGETGDWKNWLTEEQANYLDNKSKQLLANTRFVTTDQ